MIELSTKNSENEEIKPLTEQMPSLQASINRLMIAMMSLYNSQDIAQNISTIFSDFSQKMREIFGEGIKSYEEWGKKGWTLPPSAQYSIFDKSPSSKAEADAIMEKYMTDDEIDLIKNALEIAGANCEELNEADICYSQKMYKSCSLLLFGIIDNNAYKYGFLDDKKRIKIGFKFADHYKEIKKYDDFSCRAVLSNTTEALKTIYNFGNNFTEEMEIINRNYLAHGMTRRSVTQLECFQIWCLAYSTLVMLNVIEECSKDEEV